VTLRKPRAGSPLPLPIVGPLGRMAERATVSVGSPPAARPPGAPHAGALHMVCVSVDVCVWPAVAPTVWGERRGRRGPRPVDCTIYAIPSDSGHWFSVALSRVPRVPRPSGAPCRVLSVHWPPLKSTLSHSPQCPRAPGLRSCHLPPCRSPSGALHAARYPAAGLGPPGPSFLFHSVPAPLGP
jgi:hypothetical protein